MYSDDVWLRLLPLCRREPEATIFNRFMSTSALSGLESLCKRQTELGSFGLDFTDPASTRAPRAYGTPTGHVVTIEQEQAIKKYLVDSLPSSRQHVQRFVLDIAVALLAMVYCIVSLL